MSNRVKSTATRGLTAAVSTLALSLGISPASASGQSYPVPPAGTAGEVAGPNQAASNQQKMEQFKSNQYKSQQFKSQQWKSEQLKSEQLKSEQLKSEQQKTQPFQ